MRTKFRPPRFMGREGRLLIDTRRVSIALSPRAGPATHELFWSRWAVPTLRG